MEEKSIVGHVSKCGSRFLAKKKKSGVAGLSMVHDHEATWNCWNNWADIGLLSCYRWTLDGVLRVGITEKTSICNLQNQSRRGMSH